MKSTEADGISIAESEDPAYSNAPVHEVHTNTLSTGELNPAELFTLQTKLWEIVAKRVRLYTGGESSSIPELTAYRILGSVCYILNIDPDDIDPVIARQLLYSDIDTLYDAALEDLRARVDALPQLWEEAALSTPLLESRALKDTLTSMQGFSQRYDTYTFAQEITCDIDYPLAHPVPESIEGVHYVIEYLNRLLIENEFMNHFELESCNKLLRRIHPDYKELLINLYEPAAVNAIGLALAEQNPFVLNVGTSTRTMILESLVNSSTRQIDRALENAAKKVSDTLRIKSDTSCSYLVSTALNLRPRVQAGLTRRNLDGIFLAF